MQKVKIFLWKKRAVMYAGILLENNLLHAENSAFITFTVLFLQALKLCSEASNMSLARITFTVAGSSFIKTPSGLITMSEISYMLPICLRSSTKALWIPPMSIWLMTNKIFFMLNSTWFHSRNSWFFRYSVRYYSSHQIPSGILPSIQSRYVHGPYQQEQVEQLCLDP